MQIYCQQRILPFGSCKVNKRSFSTNRAFECEVSKNIKQAQMGEFWS